MTRSLHFHVFSIVSLMGTSCCGLNSVHKCMLINFNNEFQSCDQPTWQLGICKWRRIYVFCSLLWTLLKWRETKSNIVCTFTPSKDQENNLYLLIQVSAHLNTKDKASSYQKGSFAEEDVYKNGRRQVSYKQSNLHSKNSSTTASTTPTWAYIHENWLWIFVLLHWSLFWKCVVDDVTHLNGEQDIMKKKAITFESTVAVKKIMEYTHPYEMKPGFIQRSTVEGKCSCHHISRCWAEVCTEWYIEGISS